MTTSDDRREPDGTAAELKTLFRQSTHYFVGVAGGMGLGLIAFPVFTRLFSVSEYGLIDLAQKILMVLAAFSKLGLQNAALRFFDPAEFKTDKDAASRYYSTMLFGAAGMAIVVTALFVGTMGVLSPAWVDPHTSTILIWAAALVTFRAMQSVQWSFLRIQERTKLYNVLSLVVRGGTIAAVLFLVWYGGAHAQMFFAGTLIVEFAVFVYLAAPLARDGFLTFAGFDRRLFWAGCVFGIPLVVQEIAYLVLDSGDRALVLYYLGADALGHYSVAYGFGAYVYTLIVTPLNLAILPVYMRIWTTQGREKTIDFLSEGLELFFIGAAAVFVLVLPSSREVLVLLASSKYLGAEKLIPPVVGGLLIYTAYFFVGAGLVIEKKTRDMAIVFVYAAVVNVALNMILLPRVGVAGAAWATLASYVVCVAFLIRSSFRYLPLRLRPRRLAMPLVAMSVAAFLASQIDFEIALLNLFCKSVVALGLYLSIMCWSDPRLRSFGSRYLAILRTRFVAEKRTQDGQLSLPERQSPHA
jgi:O-antigen/teichoic acid export membrane protein